MKDIKSIILKQILNCIQTLKKSIDIFLEWVGISIVRKVIFHIITLPLKPLLLIISLICRGLIKDIDNKVESTVNDLLSARQTAWKSGDTKSYNKYNKELKQVNKIFAKVDADYETI